MNPVLIFTDNRQIQQEKDVLTKAVPFFQSIYDAFKSLSIPVTLTEISNLVSWTIGRNGTPNFVQNFAVDKLLAISGPYVFGGITLTPEKVKNMMVIPDTTPIENILNQVFNLFNDGTGRTGTRADLLTLTGDVISKINTADNQIEATYTYYTKTDASAQLANDLLTVCASMNVFDAIYNNALKQHLAPVGNAVRVIDNEFVVNLDFVRAYEAKL